MPASLLFASSPTLRGVTRNESTRSDSSAASNTSQSSATGNKKVSFNKAVRVKKYPRPTTTQKNESNSYEDANGGGVPSSLNGGGEDIPESTGKRFWFKVYKNKHRQSPDPNEFRRKNNVIYYGNDVNGNNNNGYHHHHDDVISYHPNPSVLNYPVFTSECGTQTPGGKKADSSRTALLGNEFTPLHPSQMPSDPPEVRRNYVKKIVNRFNEEAVLQRHRPVEVDPGGSPPMSPPGSPRMHSTPNNNRQIPIPPPPPPPVYSSYSTMNLPPQPEGLFATPKTKKVPIVNGVKVMFGMEDNKKEDKNNHSSYEDFYERKSTSNGLVKSKPGSYKTEILISDGSETDIKSPYRSHDSFLYGDLEHSNAVVKRNGNTSVSNGWNDQEGGYEYNFEDGDDPGRRSKYHVEAWDSGNQLVFDTTDENTETRQTDEGHFVSTVGEKHQLWRNNKRVIVYEQPSPTIIRRKAKSQTDLRKPEIKYIPEEKLDKGVSTDELFVRKPEIKDTLTRKNKESFLRHFRSSTKDKGIQCNKVPSDEPQELYGFGRYKIIKPRNGTVTAYSNVPKLDKNRHKDNTVSSQVDGFNSKDSVIYSQVDKSKKKKNSDKEKKKGIFSDEGKIGGLFKARSEPLYIGPPPKSPPHIEEEDEFEERVDRTIKTSKKSFGFRLGASKKDDRGRGSPYHEEDWYNVDGEVEAIERQKRRGRNHRDISEVRQEIAEEEISDASSLSNGEHKRNGGGAGSVMREVDYKKREISYENVPRSDGETNGHTNVGSGMWYRDADEDYRREMAQSEVSYPAGNSVGSDRFYTVDRKEKHNKKLPPPSPRAYTLDRRHMKNNDKQQKSVQNTSGVKILVNGKEIKDKSSMKKPSSSSSRKRDDPSSVQSDPLCVRGGLAAAYQARQRAAVRRSNSSVSGMSSRYSGSSPNIRRIVSSDMSAASSESESSRHRRPLVMYIPGISHTEKSPEKEDRVSSSIARSQSMLSPTRPPRMVKKSNHRSNHHKGSKADLYRNGDIYEEDEIMPLASEVNNRKKPPRVPTDSKKHRDIKRSHSMPKDNKFSWLKWKIRGKPSREP